MKQLMKILGITGIFLCISGLGIFAIGCAYGGTDYIETTEYENFKKVLHPTEDTAQKEASENKVSSSNMKSARQNAKDVNTYKIKDKKLGTFSSITADLDYVDLIIKPSKNNSAYLSYELHCKNNKNPFSYDIKNGCLHLKESNFKEISWNAIENNKTITVINEWKYINNYTNAVTLYVPSGTFYESSSFILNDGDLLIDGLHCQKANLRLNDGDATISKLFCNNAAVTTTDGDIKMTNMNITRNAKITTEDGDITLAKVKVPGTLQLDTMDGDIRGGLSVSGTLKIDTEDGDINAPGLSISGTAQINTLDGDINAPNLGISGTLQINTEDGDLNIPKLYTYASGIVKISTSYGDVNASGLNILGNVQLKSMGGDISLQINKKCLSRTTINMDVTDGEISANKSLNGSKKRKGDGWHYTKKAPRGNAYLKVFTEDGDISIK